MHTQEKIEERHPTNESSLNPNIMKKGLSFGLIEKHIGILLKDERSPVWFLPLDVTICHFFLVFLWSYTKIATFFAQIKDKEILQNAPL